MRSSSSSAALSLSLLLLIYLVLAAAYSIAVPLFEGPDEDDHFRYAKFLADQRHLPVQLFQPGGGQAGHQGWQPPLYYALVGAVVSQIDTSDLDTHLWRNPAASYQGDRTCCGRNLYFHTSSEDYPYTRTTLAVHLARGVSILFGAITIILIFALVMELYASVPLAVAAGAVAGLNPGFLFTNSLVSNDSALAAFATFALYLMVRMLRSQTVPGLAGFGLLGITIALALLIKTTALGLVPFALAVGGYIAWRSQRLQVLINAIVGILFPIALLTGWWFIRNQVLYGDPLAYRLMAASATFPREQALTIPELFQISLPWLWQTFWGGPTPGDFPAVLLVALGVLSAFALFGAVIHFISAWDISLRASLVLLAGWLLFIFLAQVQFIRTSGGTDQGRYLFPAISSFALLFAVGLAQVGERLMRVLLPRTATVRWAPVVLPLAFAGLSLFVLLANTIPAYARPQPVDAKIAVKAQKALNANFSDQMVLRGYSLSTRTVRRGDTVRVTLYWTAAQAMRVSYRVFVHFVDEKGRVAGGRDVIPGNGNYATVLWQPGEWIEDTVPVAVDRDALPGTYQVEIGIYPFGQPDNRVNLKGTEGDRVLVDELTITP